jgi:hypothetical protein
VDEFSSAEQALVALHHITQTIGEDDLHRPTPCDHWDVAALAHHLIDTIARLGAAAGLHAAAPNCGSIDQRIQQLMQPILAQWRCRGLSGNVPFSGRTLPARLALGVLSLELEWSTAGISPSRFTAPFTSPTMTPRTSSVWPSRPSPHRAASPPDSTHPCPCPPSPAHSSGSSPTPAATHCKRPHQATNPASAERTGDDFHEYHHRLDRCRRRPSAPTSWRSDGPRLPRQTQTRSPKRWAAPLPISLGPAHLPSAYHYWTSRRNGCRHRSSDELHRPQRHPSPGQGAPPRRRATRLCRDGRRTRPALNGAHHLNMIHPEFCQPDRSPM